MSKHQVVFSQTVPVINILIYTNYRRIDLLFLFIAIN